MSDVNQNAENPPSEWGQDCYPCSASSTLKQIWEVQAEAKAKELKLKEQVNELHEANFHAWGTIGGKLIFVFHIWHNYNSMNLTCLCTVQASKIEAQAKHIKELEKLNADLTKGSDTTEKSLEGNP